MVKLSRRMTAGWAPGVWWRFGRRLGVGGSVSGFEAKAMAEMPGAGPGRPGRKAEAGLGGKWSGEPVGNGRLPGWSAAPPRAA